MTDPHYEIFGAVIAYLNDQGLFGKAGTWSYDCARLGILSVWMGRDGWVKLWTPKPMLLPMEITKGLSDAALEAMGWKAKGGEK